MIRIFAMTICLGFSLLLMANMQVASVQAVPSHSPSLGPSHGLSAFGDLKYPKNFKHFAYVNPNAPKGGDLSQIGTAGLITFNSFNPFIIKGDAAQGMDFIYDTLMVRAYDEPDAMYGLVAQTVDVASDKMSVTFSLRKEAKFSDGTPLTADDVVFSFDILKKEGSPVLSSGLRDVVEAKALDKHTVKYSFKGKLVRDLPLAVAGLPILSKAYYSKQAFNKTSLDRPVGSGPYKIGNFKAGQFITYDRRVDYWAKDLPVNVGRYNFDRLRYEYFRDRTAEFEALKAGAYDLREEFTSRVWATGYKIPQVKSGRLKQVVLGDARPSGAQGFFINTRHEKFKDPRVRKALDYAFNYEWTNRIMFHGLYERTSSYFENSPMKAVGKATKEERALLAPFKGKLPKGVLENDAYVPPVSQDTGQDRKNLLIAKKLLEEAGWKVRAEKVKDACGFFCSMMRTIGLSSAKTKKVLRNEKGETLDIEFLMFSPSFERIVLPFAKNLKVLGIDARVRMVDASQFQERMKSFDFDITTQRFVLGMTPGISLRNYMGADAAGQKGSFNLSGISSPVIDALIEKIIAAKSREELNIAARSLDRVMRASHYWIPHWHKASHWVAYWDKFSGPKEKPQYARGILDLWWYDKEKAEKLEQKVKKN